MLAIPRWRAACTAALALLTAVPLGATSLEDKEVLQAQALVDEVLRVNPRLESLEAAVREADARVQPAGSLEDPHLTYETAPRTFSAGVRDSHMVSISQSIPWPGTLGLREATAERRAEAASHRLQAARLQVAALAHEAYAEWHFIHRALEINRDTQALFADLVESSEALYAAGRARQQDVLRAERERLHLQHQALSYQRQRDSLRAQINALLNRQPGATLPPPDELVEPDRLPNAERLRHWAARRHPELNRLQAQVDAQDRQRELAEKAFYPDFEVMTGYNNMWDATEMRWSVGIGINIPLNRSRRRANLDAAEAGKLRAQSELAERRAQLLAQLDSTAAELRESAHILQLYSERLVPLARETLNASLAAYRAGNGDFLDVSEAAREVLRSELERARSRSDYARRLAELDRWSGGRLQTLDSPASVSPHLSGGQHE